MSVLFQCMSHCIAKHSLQNNSSAEFCKPFLKIFLEMILSQKVGKDNIPSISSVLFGLISAFPVIVDCIFEKLIDIGTCYECYCFFRRPTQNLFINYLALGVMPNPKII